MEGATASGTHSPLERKDNSVLKIPEHEANMDSLPGLINKREKNNL